jgi:hypothetical protein
MKRLIYILLLIISATVFADGPKLPDFKQTAYDTFQTKILSEPFLLSKRYKVQKYFDISFDVMNVNYYSVFYETNDNENTCHVCTPQISIVNYQLMNDKWTLISVQRNIEAAIGGNGELPDIINNSIPDDEFRVVNTNKYTSPDKIFLSSKNFAIKITDHFMLHGEVSQSIHLLVFIPSGREDGQMSEWKYIGQLNTGYDNSGFYEDTDSNKRYTWTSTLKVHTETNEEFPDITVETNGTMSDADSKICKAKNLKYRFVSSSYIDIDELVKNKFKCEN